MSRFVASIRHLKHGLMVLFLNDVVARVPSHHFRLFAYRCLGFSVESGASVHRSVRFERTGNVTLGRDSVINRNCRIDNRAPVAIGRWVSISEDVQILTADHDVQAADFGGRNRPVVLGDFSFVGTRATILPGVSVGHGAVVAAGAVVSKDVPEFAIVAGVPAQVIGRRRRDIDYDTRYRPLFR